MSLRQLSALARRQAIVLLVVFLVLLGIAYSFKKTPQVFQETATVVLMTSEPNPYVPQFSSTLINTGELLVQWTVGPEGQAALQRAGAGTGFDIDLVNFYNQEYPLYSQPYLTVTGSGVGAAATRKVFTAGLRVFDNKLAAIQTAEGAKPADFITTKLIGDSGPIIQLGSNKRAYGGLALLGIIAAYMAATFFDRRGIQLSGFGRLSSLGRRRSG